jgi:hypothetical protein
MKYIIGSFIVILVILGGWGSLRLLAFYGPNPRNDKEQIGANISLNQMRMIHGEILLRVESNQSGNLNEWINDIIARKGVDFFRCKQNTNLLVCINPDSRCFSTNLDAPDELVMYAPIQFHPYRVNRSFIRGLLSSGAGTNLHTIPNWQPYVFTNK